MYSDFFSFFDNIILKSIQIGVGNFIDWKVFRTKLFLSLSKCASFNGDPFLKAKQKKII